MGVSRRLGGENRPRPGNTPGPCQLAGKKLATFTLETEVRFASASDRDAFTRELSSKIAELAVRYHDAHASHGRLFRFLLGAYPAITKTEEEAEDSPRFQQRSTSHEHKEKPIVREEV